MSSSEGWRRASPVGVVRSQGAHPEAVEELVGPVVCQELHVVDLQAVALAQDRVQCLLDVGVDRNLRTSSSSMAVQGIGDLNSQQVKACSCLCSKSGVPTGRLSKDGGPSFSHPRGCPDVTQG